MHHPIEHITLSHLNGIIQSALNNAFYRRSFWIVADVTEHSYKQATGYHFFEFVEKDPLTNRITAKIRASAWGNASRRIVEFENTTGQKFTDSLHILARVSVTYHKVYGISLNLEDIDPNFTLGVIETKRQQTLQFLLTKYPAVIQQQGDTYSTRNSLLELPPVISRLAVISSETPAVRSLLTLSNQHNKSCDLERYNR